MNKTQKLLEVARFVFPDWTWMVNPKGVVCGYQRKLASDPMEQMEFDLSDRKTRQDVIMKLDKHNWKIEKRKNYWLGLKVDETGTTEIKRDSFEELVWDLVGRVNQ